MIFFTKSILSLVLIGLAIINLLVMLEVLGRTGENRINPAKLRLIHRIVGYLFILLFIFISYFCIKIMRGMGQELTSRASLHALLASATFFLLCLKITIVRFYKKFYSMAVSMGLGVFILIITTAAISAGYYFAMGGVGSFQITADLQEDIAKDGAILFNEKGCADCHYADKGEIKIGPGLKDLFKKDKLPASARPVTEDNIRRQLMEPFRGMPAYPDLPEKELQALLAFLKSI